ncbi:spore gernimation protein GerPD [Sediminibacillus massiliensis]|uniref:spore gernimation protein GerPD n=1 Tax=Sediminibacillus massiliensis TaxID=1926277 RepID=UPI0009886A43|nr:spore gernimation protein GerPD [Sediminibacillus massiliensis]
MKFEVHNYGIQIGDIEVTGVTTSSVFLVGDNEEITLYSFFDTPPESLIVGSPVPMRNLDDTNTE